METMNPDVISKMEQIVTEDDSNSKTAYQEIEVIQFARSLKNGNSVDENKILEIKDYIEQASLNMDFLGIDLTQVPTKNPKDFKVLIIPILYVISSFISIRLSMSSTTKKKKEEKKLITDGSEEQEEKYNPSEDVNKTMGWMMPIMSVTIAIIAPLGLALYWLMNNILMIIERLVINKFLNKEEAKENA